VSRRAKNYQGVALIAPYTLPYQRKTEQSTASFIGRTLAAMLDQSGLKKDEVDGLAISSFSLAPDSIVTLTENFGLQPKWLEQIPLGGASGVVAMQRAARAVQSGDAEVIACIGGDAIDMSQFVGLVSNFSTFTVDSAYPYGAAGPNGAFSLITRYYMDNFGATREDFGQIAVSQRYNANHYKDALFYDKPLDMDTYLNAPPIAGNIHLFDCVMPCSGADGFIVTSVERAKQLQVPWVEILSCGEQYNAFPDDPVQHRGGWHYFRDDLYESAGLGPQDMQFLQTYDDYPVICMLQMEGLGFCGVGEAPTFVRNTSMTFDGGGLPHNTNGGQLSVGQAGSSGGFLGLVEGIRQLNNQAQEHQIPNVEVGVISGYGMVNYNRGLCSSATIIQRGKA